MVPAVRGSLSHLVPWELARAALAAALEKSPLDVLAMPGEDGAAQVARRRSSIFFQYHGNSVLHTNAMA